MNPTGDQLELDVENVAPARSSDLADAVLRNEVPQAAVERRREERIMHARLNIETTPQEREAARRAGYWMGPQSCPTCGCGCATNEGGRRGR